MKKLKLNQKTALYAGGIAAALVIIYLLNQRRIKRAYAQIVTGGNDPANPPTINPDKVLKRGSVGAEVFELQKLLVADGQNIGTTGKDKNGVDGDFGPKTEAGLMTLTGKKQITLNGYEAAKTLYKEGVSLPGTTPQAQATATAMMPTTNNGNARMFQ